jgi:hypothetical protein
MAAANVARAVRYALDPSPVSFCSCRPVRYFAAADGEAGSVMQPY